MREVVIEGAVRTPIGSHGGALRDLTAQELARIVMVAVKTGRGFLEHPGQDRGQDG